MDKAGQADLADADEGAPGARAPGEAARGGRVPAGDPPDGDGPDGPEPGGSGRDSGEVARGPAAEEEGPEVPYWLSQVPYFLVMSALAAGIVVVAAAYFKRGPAIIAGALLLAATFRVLLPRDWVGMLAVRRRWIDLLTLSTLAVLLIVLAWVAPQLSA
ncbi:DUF3017 domain-containing protein [Nocardiopsis alborubida]|uniref:DUF3017 domain-containing protein n=1 Tax=Nocardiopsis alborubida TaxID=146802 RepID=A0A7X6RS60_9ACTN|nr:DUF3017 domain-containing protein [Nocardiopsis alborubida]NKZ00329.1 DUF3017 domain-containing protein [Nocardiopsis alborubida]